MAKIPLITDDDPPLKSPIFTKADFDRVVDAYKKTHGSAAPSQILVGGQALNAWLLAFKIDLGNIESPYILTDDIDFLSNLKDAKKLSTEMGAKFFPAKINSHDVCCATATFNGSDPALAEVLQIDFLNSVCGISDAELKKHAVPLDVEGCILSVMHPIHCLISRFANLEKIEKKRRGNGPIQARIAVALAKRTIEQYIADNDFRSAHKLLKMIYALCESAAGLYVNYEYAIDPLDAIPDLTGLNANIQRQIDDLRANLNEKRINYAHNKTSANKKIIACAMQQLNK